MCLPNIHQLLNMLREHENGKTLSEICEVYGIDEATFLTWKHSYLSDSNIRNFAPIHILESLETQYQAMFLEIVHTQHIDETYDALALMLYYLSLCPKNEEGTIDFGAFKHLPSA